MKLQGLLGPNINGMVLSSSLFRIVSDDPIRHSRQPTLADIVQHTYKTLYKKCFKNLLTWNCIADWVQTLLEWSLGGLLSELRPQWPQQPSKACNISRYSLNMGPYAKNVLKIFSSETDWSFGTKIRMSKLIHKWANLCLVSDAA